MLYPLFHEWYPRPPLLLFFWKWNSCVLILTDFCDNVLDRLDMHEFKSMIMTHFTKNLALLLPSLSKQFATLVIF